MSSEKKKPKKQPEVIVIKQRVEPLPVKLNNDELLERSQRLADTETQMREHEAHAESVKKDLKAKEQAISSERSRLAGIVKAKAEPREVRISCEAHMAEREYVEVRQDSGEVIFRRPLRPEEMQSKLDLDDDKHLAAPRVADPGQLERPNAAGDFPEDEE